MADKIRCDACPVMCFIADGMTGACDRYANAAGELVRVDPHVLLGRAVEGGTDLVAFLGGDESGSTTFVTAIGAGTTYPDYKPAPFIVSSEVDGIDMITVVTEGIFSYCGVKVKIDTDRFLGPEGAAVRAGGEAVGHVTTGEYGSQMLSLGGVHHLTGGSKREGKATCDALLDLCNRKPVDLSIDGGATLTVAAGQAPVIDGVREVRMRVGCGSATIGMFAPQWLGLVDEVVVVDDHITGVISEHQAGKVIGWPDTGIRMRGRRSTPGRYFNVANPGTGWGGTDLTDPLTIVERFDAAKGARPGLTLFMVSTTGEHAAYYVLDEALRPVAAQVPPPLEAVAARIRENCEPALTTVLFMGGAGGSLRSGVTDNPVRLTWSVKNAVTRVTCGGAPTYVWPGGGITFMVDVSKLPEGAFGSVPTPALVAPIEFSLPRHAYVALGGHVDQIRPLDEVASASPNRIAPDQTNPWPLQSSPFPAGGRGPG
ncbi:MAG: 6-hydroxynicotinate reductase [Janthinobacterium lividum]